ncbi:MAG TPA: integrase core domain-containing protein [Myxococcota bacterium]|nr:integrase core domain-containing protein [Myxococcota bacterium]
MKVFGLQGAVYRFAGMASRLRAETSPIAAGRRDALARFHQARCDGLTAEQAANAVGVPRATLHRWARQLEPRSRRPHRVRQKSWPSALVRAVERLRLDFPMWGRAKIGPLIRQAGFAASDTTVGRIIRSLVERGVIEPVPTLRRRPRSHRWSARRRHAVRLPKGLKPDRPGGLVQIDTLFVTLAPGRAIKHFTAYDPVAKWTVGKAARRATSQAASLFLDKVLAEMPFPVQAIQVDGGAEFKAAFEEACQAKGLALYELPPKRPQLNGAVERCNAAWRYEFYQTYDLPAAVDALNPILDSFQHLYNHHRPHGALAGLTPAAYLAQCQAAETPRPI